MRSSLVGKVAWRGTESEGDVVGLREVVGEGIVDDEDDDDSAGNIESVDGGGGTGGGDGRDEDASGGLSLLEFETGTRFRGRGNKREEAVRSSG